MKLPLHIIKQLKWENIRGSLGCDKSAILPLNIGFGKDSNEFNQSFFLLRGIEGKVNVQNAQDKYSFNIYRATQNSDRQWESQGLNAVSLVISA